MTRIVDYTIEYPSIKTEIFQVGGRNNEERER